MSTQISMIPVFDTIRQAELDEARQMRGASYEARVNDAVLNGTPLPPRISEPADPAVVRTARARRTSTLRASK